MKNILILHISDFGGHSKAAKNIKEALSHISDSVVVKDLNVFGHFYPRIEKMVDYMYTKVILHIPALWGRMYDRKPLVKRLDPFRKIVSFQTFKKIARLIETHKPDCIVTTQAFPCGLFGDYKERFGLKTPLVAAVTDYHPHRFWVHPRVDYYIVACQQAHDALVAEGVEPERIQILGIPISIQFMKHYPKAQAIREMGFIVGKPLVLLMGGGLGLGPIGYIAAELDKLDHDFQLVVVCGKNKKLHDWFTTHKTQFNKPLFLFEYTTAIAKIMDCTDIIVTKAGGITVSEALAKGLAIVITDAIPGQEERNVRYLLNKGAIVEAQASEQVASLVNELLRDPVQRYTLQSQAKKVAIVDSSLKIAQLTLRVLSQQRNDLG